MLVLRQRATAPDEPLPSGEPARTGPRPACGTVKDGTLVSHRPRSSTRNLTFAFLSADGERLVTDVRERQGNTSKLTAIRVVRVSDGKELARMSVDRSERARKGVICLAGSPDLAKVLLCDTRLASPLNTSYVCTT